MKTKKKIQPAIWKWAEWFYQDGIFVLISKSEKNMYKYEIFGDGTAYSATHFFLTEEGAKKGARGCLSDMKKRGHTPEPLTFEQLLARKGIPCP